jgi:hypothetical protein
MLAGSSERAEADRARAILLTLSGWSTERATLPQPMALKIRRVRVRDRFRVLDVKIEGILSANSFVHGALVSQSRMIWDST